MIRSFAALVAFVFLVTSVGSPTVPAYAAVRSNVAAVPIPALHARVAAASRRASAAAVAAIGTTLIGEGFSAGSTTANAWLTIGGACLTAGTSATPATSLPACKGNAVVDAVGQGALQLTQSATNQAALVLYQTPLPTSNGLQITFTDYSFNGSAMGADGLTLFLSDASKAMPTALGQPGGSLGYASANGLPGIANAYVGVGLDEYGNFSNPTQGRKGGPGQIAETLAVRGAASLGYPYLGGATGAGGRAASLPFKFDTAAVTTRPSVAPTVQLIFTPSGQLSAAIDRHDGNGFVTYYSGAIVGVAGQPAVPSSVYVGLTASTGASYNRHQIGSFAVTSLRAGTSFAPGQLGNLASWFDGADATSVVQSGGAMSGWTDKSGSGNSLGQSVAANQPVFTSAGINGLSSVSFNGAAYMLGADAAFSSKLFNESTTFIVSNQANSTQDTSLAWSGQYRVNPRWNLRLSEQNHTNWDFNTYNSRTSVLDVPTGPAIWSAGGSVSTHVQYLRKNGNVLGIGTGPAGPVSGNYPLAVGAMANATTVANQYVGQLGEMLVYNRLLSASESAQVEGYLACKWSLQSRLPANHPYRYVCPQSTLGVYPTPAPAPADALPQPLELRSQNGSLVFNVSAQLSASTGNPQLSYNGSGVPPTLRVLPGDTVMVNIANGLPTPAAGSTYMNDVSLHYHGLHVTPNAPGDDSIDMIAGPGQSLHYQFTIPANAPPGLYWYHSHAHGETERQTLAGMSGALIVDGIAQYVPQVANLPERVLIVRDAPIPGQPLAHGNALQTKAMRWSMQHGAAMGPRPAAVMSRMPLMNHMHVEVRAKTTIAARNPYVLVNPAYRKFRKPLAVSTHCTASETPVKSLTVNGQLQPSIAIRPGEQQFWRLVNAGADTYLDVQVDNAQLQIVALDGVPLASGTNAPSVLTVNDYVVPPSSRIEFIVTGPPAGTAAYLRTNCFDAGPSGDPMPATVLASLNANASITDQAKLRSVSQAKQRVGRVRLPALRTARAIKAQAVARTQTLFYSDQNTIDGVAYDPGAPPLFYAQSGTVEEWTIVNNASQVHTFHIHQIHFVLEAINGATLAQQYLLDNVNVPAATAAGPGTVKLLLDFTDPLEIGTFLLHCHILSHEDGGMMAKIRVGTAPPLALSNSTLTFASTAATAQTVTITGGAAPFSVNGCATVANATVTGSMIAISPVGVGSCVLTVADSSGLIGSIGVSVQGAAPVLSATPNSVSFAGTGAASQIVTLSGGTAPYTATGCTGTAVATISGAAVAIAPVAVGSCTLTFTDAAANSTTVAVSVNAAAAGSPADNVTFHQNALRSGWYQAEQKLTPATVAAANFGLLGTLTAPAGLPAFGKVYAQPLYVSAETVADGSTHNLVVVATSTDQIYAYDDVTRAVVWHRDFTNPAAGITQQLWSDSGCADVNPNIGITGTPVIDRARDVLYVVVATKENGNFHLRLHAISMKSGFEATDGNGNQVGPTEVTATYALASGGTASVDPIYNFQRSALLEANGNIYVALASHCDYRSSSTHGWMLAYSATSMQQTGNMLDLTNLNDGSNYFLGSPWMGGYGPSSDAQGNVYFATGNGPLNGTTDFSMSVLGLPGTLDIGKARYFSPAGSVGDSKADDDLGSGGVMLLPDLPGTYPHVLVAGGKCGAGSANGGTSGCIKYLLNRDNLGGHTAGDAGALWRADTGGAIWGGPASFQDANGTNYIVYGGGSPLSTYTLSTAPIGLTIQSSANVGCLECRDSGSQPVVSSNGTQPSTAVVWALKTPGNSGGTISLYAFDALNMGHTLFTGAAGGWTQASGTGWIGGALVSPLVANGSVYVPVDGGVAVFGLH